jgi:hypothetical protein
MNADILDKNKNQPIFGYSVKMEALTGLQILTDGFIKSSRCKARKN